MEKSVQEAMITLKRNMEIPKGLERLVQYTLELVFREGEMAGLERGYDKSIEIIRGEKPTTEEQLIERERVSTDVTSSESTIL